MARQQGYELHRDRAGVWSFTHQGGWQIVDAERNWLVVGERFDLSLGDAEQWPTEDKKATASMAAMRDGSFLGNTEPVCRPETVRSL